MPAAGRGGGSGQGGGGGGRLNGGGGGKVSEEERGELREVRERLLDLLEDREEDRSRDADRLSRLNLCERSDGCFFLLCFFFFPYFLVYT